jgi:site-specific DNA-cytosine methylase
MTLSMLDLFSGTGGASAAMRARGWKVVTLELDQQHRPDIIGDVTRLPIRHRRGLFDLVWASPPCTEYARESMPWCRTGVAPDQTLWNAAMDAIISLQPRWWVIENVRGAAQWRGRPRRILGPIFLWGDFPPFHPRISGWKEKLWSRDKVARAAMPYALSEALAIACETEAALLPAPACRLRRPVH